MDYPANKVSVIVAMFRTTRLGSFALEDWTLQILMDVDLWY
jgi:hypothetical protein